MEIRYWRRLRGYQRLDGSAKKAKSGRRNVKRVKMDKTRKRRFWRIKIVPKLRILKRASPKKLLTWLRDAYVNMMLRLANSRVVGSSYGYGEYGYGPGLASKEYDEKKLVEIYKSILMAQGNLVHRDVPKLPSNSILLSPLRGDHVRGSCQNLHPGPVSMLHWSESGKPWFRLDSRTTLSTLEILSAPYGHSD